MATTARLSRPLPSQGVRRKIVTAAPARQCHDPETRVSSPWPA